MRYPDLSQVKHIWDALDKRGRLIVLFLTESTSSGHWIAVFQIVDKELEYFDPYGLPWDAEFEWLTPLQRKELGQTRKEMSRLMADARAHGYKVTYNTTSFQSGRSTVNSCGRWVAARLMNSELSEQQLIQLINRTGVPPDVFVTVLTNNLLHDGITPPA
jgi:hypothetical protein